MILTSMDDISVTELLDADTRPTFVVDLHAAASGNKLNVHFRNRVLRLDEAFLGAILADDVQSNKFRAWILDSGITSSQRWYKGSLWFTFTVGHRWKVVQSLGLPEDPPAESLGNGGSKSLPLAKLTEFSDTRYETAKATFGLTTASIQSVPGLNNLVKHMSRVDWSKTFMGPLHKWPADVLQIVHLMLMYPQAKVLYIGPENEMIYNVQYSILLGDRHPASLGQSLYRAWPETAGFNRATLDQIDRTGAPYSVQNHCIILNRSGYTEESYFDWTTSPLQGSLHGYFTSATEVTNELIAERRKATIVALSTAYPAGSRDLKTLWQASLQALQTNEKDIPLGFMYSLSGKTDNVDDGNHSSTLPNNQEYRLEGVLGFPADNLPLPSLIDLGTDESCFAPAFRIASTQEKFVSLSRKGLSLPENLVQKSKHRGFGDPCQDAIVCPVRGRGASTTLAFLVVGLNTRKRYDEAYKAWLTNIVNVLGENATMAKTAQAEYDERRQAEIRREDEDRAMKEKLASTTIKTVTMNAKLQGLFQTLQTVNIGMFEYDPNGKLVQANDAYYTMSGYPRDPDAPAFTFLNLIYEEEREMVLEKWDELTRGNPVTFEMRWKTEPRVEPGTLTEVEGRWILAACVPQNDENGALASISGYTTDIDAQKRNENHAMAKQSEALAQASASEQKFFQFAEMIPVAISIVSPSGEMQYCNEEWFNATGHPKVPFDQINWNDVVFEEDVERTNDTVGQALMTGETLKFECRLRRTTVNEHGEVEPTWGAATVRADLAEDGTIRSVMGAMADISHFKMAERLQQSIVDEALETKRQTENFIDMTSHEIRNPLGAVVHCADSILASLKDIEQNLTPSERRNLDESLDTGFEAVNTIMSCTGHMKRIIDDILTLSKLDSRLLKISPALTRPESIIEDVLSMFDVDAQKVGVDLNIVKDTSISILGNDWVMVDAGRLMQVLINLTTNAIKFTQQEQRKRIVTLAMGASKERPSEEDLGVRFAQTASVPEASSCGSGETVYLYFVVQDSGCGLSSDEMTRLFARFSQGSHRTHTKYGGSGLGLFISRELTELQGGEIGVGSETGLGSTFAFYIRTSLAKPPIHNGNGALHLEKDHFRTNGHSSTSHHASYSILVVEDNLINQKVLCMQLKKLGHEVHVASHGLEALDFLRSTKHWNNQSSKTTKAVDVILMDVEMPMMNGVECTAKIRQLESAGQIVGHLPIIAQSANAREEQVTQALEAGMDDAVCKPFRVVDLMPKIERLTVRHNGPQKVVG